MKKLALLALLLTAAACGKTQPFAYNNRSAEIDYEILNRQYACAQDYACSPHPVPYYLK